MAAKTLMDEMLTARDAVAAKAKQMKGAAAPIVKKAKNVVGNLTGSREVSKVRDMLQGK